MNICNCSDLREAMTDGVHNPEGLEEYRQAFGHYPFCNTRKPETRIVNGEDCQGRSYSYVQANLKAKDGKLFMSNGPTVETASADVQNQVDQYERFCLLPPKERLSKLLQKKSLLSSDMELAIRIIGEILASS